MTSIGSAGGSAPYVDRATYLARHVSAHNRQEGVKPITLEEVTAELEAQELSVLKTTQSLEAFYRGEGTPVRVGEPGKHEEALQQARAARSKHYSQKAGPVSIRALDVNAAVKAQGQLTGSDLKNLSAYGDHLRNELSAASSVRRDVTFTGAWGKDRITHDVNEYMGWITQAMQQSSQNATNSNNY